ncbi:MAG: DUF1489 domain-containing protein [Caulobacteraceae bacterium]|jgi:hypothetical protein
MTLHLIKLCVGCDTVEELLAWRAEHASTGDVEEAAPGEPWILRTRQTPKRAAELTDGGSLYRVYRGQILSRQRILDVRTVAEGVTARCEIRLDETVVRTLPTPRRAFQGWRYLAATDAPPDLADGGFAEGAPEHLVRQLRELGAW